MGTCGTGRGHSNIGTLEAIPNGKVAGNHVDDCARYKKRRHAARPFVFDCQGSVLDRAQTTYPRADVAANTFGVFGGNLQTGVVNGLNPGHHTVLNEQIELARFLGSHVRLDVELAHQGGAMTRILRRDQRDALQRPHRPRGDVVQVSDRRGHHVERPHDHLR